MQVIIKDIKERQILNGKKIKGVAVTMLIICKDMDEALSTSKHLPLILKNELENQTVLVQHGKH